MPRDNHSDIETAVGELRRRLQDLQDAIGDKERNPGRVSALAKRLKRACETTRKLIG